MKTLQEIKGTLAQYLPRLIQEYNLKEIGVFGSYEKDKQTEESDLDILVDFEEVPSLFKFVGLKLELSDLLNMNVDVVI